MIDSIMTTSFSVTKKTAADFNQSKNQQNHIRFFVNKAADIL